MTSHDRPVAPLLLDRSEAPARLLDRRLLLRTGLLATAATPLVTSTGCATLLDLLSGIVKKPDLSFKNFKITKMSLTNFAVSLTAVLKNPNPFGFRLEGLDWIVNLAGGQAAKGRMPKGLTLKARGTAESDLALDFDLAKTTQALIDLFTKRRVPLGINATGTVKANKYEFDIPAKFETQLSMPTMPQFDVPRFAVRSVGASGVAFVVEPLIKNQNGFDLDIDAFDFDIKLNGRNVLRNKTIKNVKVAKNRSERVPFEFRTDLVDLGLTALSLASSPRLDWEVGAAMRSGFLDLPFKQRGSVRL